MEREAYQELYEQEPHHWWYRGMRRITERLLRSTLAAPSHLSILDAGCGVGGNMTALAEFGRTTGIDISPLALDYAVRANRQRLAQATVERLPFADNIFDLVTSFDVLYHERVLDDGCALRELARVVRPGGHLLIRLPALPLLHGPHDLVVHGRRRYTAQQLRQLVCNVGLNPIRLTYLNSLLLPLIFVMRRIQTLAVRLGSTPQSDIRGESLLISTILFRLLTFEGWWIERGSNFPSGVSVLCLAIKPT